MPGPPANVIRLILICCLWGSLPAAWSANQQDRPAFPLSSPLSRKLQSLSGLTYLSGRLASGLAALWLKHQVGGSVKVRIKPYSFTDLLSGKLQSAAVRLQNASYKGVPVEKLEISSVNPIWIRLRKSKMYATGVASPLLVKISGLVKQDNLSRALASPEVSQALHMIKIDLPGLGKQQLQFLHPRVELSPNRVAITSTLVTAGADETSGVSIFLAGQPYLDGSRVLIKDLQVASPDISCPLEFADFTQQLLNPLVDLSRMDRLDHAFRLVSLKIEDQQITFDGNLLLAPRPAKTQVVQKAVTEK